MGTEEKSVKDLKLIGGKLCLDFTNTVDGHRLTCPVEQLTSYDELVSWSEHAGVLDAAVASQLHQKANDYPDTAAAVLKRAITLREAIYRIFSAIANGRKPPAKDLALLNDELALESPKRHVVLSKEGFTYDWGRDRAALDWMVAPIVQSAADLVTSDELARVKQCDAYDCGWLFFDQSKNRSRRWCDMKGCGNRAKARRCYTRKCSSDKSGAC